MYQGNAASSPKMTGLVGMGVGRMPLYWPHVGAAIGDRCDNNVIRDLWSSFLGTMQLVWLHVHTKAARGDQQDMCNGH